MRQSPHGPQPAVYSLHGGSLVWQNPIICSIGSKATITSRDVAREHFESARVFHVGKRFVSMAKPDTRIVLLQSLPTYYSPLARASRG